MSVDTANPDINTFQAPELVLSVGLLGVLVVLIMPLPTVVLDTFLAANLSVAIVLLLITLNIAKPLEISVFPSLLLLLTLARLSLNVATTRLILLNGDAGKIVSTFGGFVVGGNIVVGLVIFLILVVIQFIVITKGAARISEVAARFTLDALPGKQMAIDAELGAGKLDEAEAKHRRDALSLEAEFYGSMDGAGKFVRGDAIAGLVITAINLIGGVIIGSMNGLSLSEAIRTYSTLTIGDGLVSQVPGLIIATTAGILVTKATSRLSLGKEIGSQMLRQTRPLVVGAAILGSLALIPGLPKIPFLLLSLLLLGFWSRQTRRSAHTEPPSEKAPSPSAAERLEQHFHEFLAVDQACVEIGVRLVPLVDPNSEQGLIGRVKELRSDLARKHGIWVPAVRVRDSLRLKPNSYRIILNGREVVKGELHTDALLAIDPGTSTGAIEGEATKDPAFGLPARWIGKNLKSRASRLGYTVVDPTTVLITHLGEVLRQHAGDLLSREDLSKLLDQLRKTAPKLVDDIKSEVLRISDIHLVLKYLLAERVPITNLVRILETLLQHAPQVKDPVMLAEYVRAALGREILDRFRDANGVVHAVVVEPQLENQLRAALKDGVLAIDAAALESFSQRLGDLRQKSLARDQEVVLLIDSGLRRAVRNAIERAVPELVVIGYSEVPRELQVQFKEMIKLHDVFLADPSAHTDLDQEHRQVELLDAA